jgi:DNA-binding CsgD family transcriptional regulator
MNQLMDRQPNFSGRENEVISLLLMGKSNKQIAQALGISTRTVEFHLGNIYNKLHINSRSEAILQLSHIQLGESTGTVKGDELRVNTVEFKDEEVHNRGKSFFSKWKPLMKTLLYFGTGLFAVLLVVTLYTLGKNKEKPILDQPTATISQANLVINSTQIPEKTAPIPSSTLTVREQIVLGKLEK